MAEAATPPERTRENERVRRVYEKEAHKYDRQMRFFERLLFAGGREWVCSQASGEVLELAVGTGRNLPHYPEGVRVTGIELSAGCSSSHARGRASSAATPTCAPATPRRSTFPTSVSTRSSAPCPSARSPTTAPLSLRHGVSCGRAVGSCYSSTRGARLLPVRVGQRLLDPLFVRFEADHLLREPLEHLRAEGFEVERLERSKLGIVERLAARKPVRARGFNG